jgi:hypothetical protein
MDGDGRLSVGADVVLYYQQICGGLVRRFPDWDRIVIDQWDIDLPGSMGYLSKAFARKVKMTVHKLNFPTLRYKHSMPFSPKEGR